MDPMREMETFPLASDLELEGRRTMLVEAKVSARAFGLECATHTIRLSCNKGATAIASAVAILGIMGLAAKGVSHQLIKHPAEAVVESTSNLQVLQGESQSLGNVMYPNGSMHLGLSPAYGLPVHNYGTDCWPGCLGKAGFCDDYCGAGNACCKYMEATDPPECRGILDFGVKGMHTCVAPVNPFYFVQVDVSNVQNWGKDCFQTCQGAGFCSSFCGTGNVCCKFGDMSTPECMGIDNFGTKEYFTCVKPTAAVAAQAPDEGNTPSLNRVIYANGTMHHGLSPAYGLPIANYGKDCWPGCMGKAGFCVNFCGAGNACCKHMEATDPPECSGITDFGVMGMHTCVAPVNPSFFVQVNVTDVKNWGKDCKPACKEAGSCKEFCGIGNACCKFGEATERVECMGVESYGNKETHTCVKPVVPIDAVIGEVMQPDGSMKVGLSPAYGLPVQNYGKDCLTACKGGGFCQEFCGSGNACCKYGEGSDPPECHGITDFGEKDTYTCVAPKNPLYFVQIGVRDESVQHWGKDCLQACGDAGYCQEFCGMGNACCKFGTSSDPAECQGVDMYGSKDRHTCVKPVRPEYVVAEMPKNTTIKNWGQDCWVACNQGGQCDEFCGTGNACCRFKSEKDPPACHGVVDFGAKDRHTCIVPVNPYYQTKVHSTGVQN